jgi:hypothetical protein
MPDLRRAPSFRSGALQFDTASERMTEHELRRHRAHRQTGGQDRRYRLQRGYPVEVRNGMPEPMRRPITDTKACGCVRRLNMAVMDWELTDPCGGPLCLS